jgi:prepilin-type N-terminal cleavage/methylation domain-containing protein
MKLNKNAFTLIEILVVIGIVSVLAIGITVALNPNIQFSQARDSVRDSHVNILEAAFNAYKFANLGSLEGLSVTGVPTDICNPNHPNPQDCVNLETLVQDGYISKLPTDPEVESGSEVLGYKVELLDEGEVVVHADYEKRDQLNWPADDGYIYREGEFVERYTTTTPVEDGSTTVVQSEEANHLLLSVYADDASNVEGGWATDLPVDLSDYNSLKIEHEITEADPLAGNFGNRLFAGPLYAIVSGSSTVDSIDFSLAVSNLMNGTYNESIDSDIELNKDSGRVTQTLDVSSINGEKYIRFHGYETDSGSETEKDRTIKVYNIWIE